MGRHGIAAQAVCLKVALGCVSVILVSAEHSAVHAQSSSVTLDQIEVEARRKPRRPARTPAASEQSQSEPAAPQESATGPVQGYVATRSATGTKTDTPIQEIPQSITVVTAEAARDQGATTVQEALRYVPGVYADAYGPDSRVDGGLIRGTTAVTYLDGMRLINGGYWNHTRPDPYTLERIEVLRGPGSVLYGDSPVGGLINLVSKRPQEKEHREIGVSYGSYNTKQMQADMTGKLTPDGEWLYRLVGVWRDADYQTDYVKNDRQTFMPAITWRPTQNTNWTVIGLYQKDKTGSSTAFLPWSGTLFSNPNGQVPVNRFVSEPGYDLYQTTTKSVSSLFEHSFSNNFKVYSNFRYSHIDGIYRTMYPDLYYNIPPSPFFPFQDAALQTVNRIVDSTYMKRDNIASDTGGQIDFATGAMTHKVLFGVDIRQVKENTDTFTALDINPFNLYNPVYGQTPVYLFPDAGGDRIRQTVTGLYIQDQARLGPWLLTAGVRRDQLVSEKEGIPRQEDSATTMRFGLMYETPFGFNPYVSYAESFEPILGADICAVFCKPKEGTQYEAGFKYRLSNSAAFNAAVFDITEKNRLASPSIPGGSSIQIGEARIRGLELEYIGKITPTLDIIAAYTYLDTEVTQGDYVGSRLDTVPTNSASLWAKQKLTLFGVPGFSIGGGVRYIGETSSTGLWYAQNTDVTIVTPDHTLFDAMFAYENDKWRFQVTATNLADTIYFSSCLARGDCFYGNRRNVLATLTYKF
jgi:iron complex outermembrane receptor protein